MSSITLPPPRRTGPANARRPAAAALAAGTVALVLVLVLGRGDESLTLHARFANAGQLVRDSPVKMAGRRIGGVAGLSVTPQGQADVEIHITDPDVLPLRAGARATIRALGQAGAANRFVDLTPGPDRGRPLADGAVLGAAQTFGIVELDSILNTFDKPMRQDLQGLFHHSADVFSGSTAPAFNRLLTKLQPAFAATARLTEDAAADDAQLQRLIRTAEVTSTAIAQRRTDLREAVGHTARTFTAMASARGALNAALRRAPAFLSGASTTLRQLRGTASELSPTLRMVPAAARPLRPLLDEAVTSLARVRPVLGDLRQQLPGLRDSLRGATALRPTLVPALRAVSDALADADPILAGFRAYTPDFLLGIFNGFAGLSSGNYGPVGHYARLEFVQSPQTFLGGGLGQFLPKQPFIPGISALRTHLENRCPGSMAPPAPDGSTPWHIAGLCDPAHDTPASVNEP
ncbi:MAG: hypothetical protein JWR63_1419 [Conexibacter sp.]|nr:hypothetical protein [Conexibacter sp.]